MMLACLLSVCVLCCARARRVGLCYCVGACQEAMRWESGWAAPVCMSVVGLKKLTAHACADSWAARPYAAAGEFWMFGNAVAVAVQLSAARRS
jgi:hypothetical protein